MKRKNPGKRCSCKTECHHGVWLRLKCRGERSYLNLSALYPGEDVGVAAARAKADVLAGKIVDGQRLEPAVLAKLTVGQILGHYRAHFADRPHHYAQALDPISHLVADTVKKHDVLRCVSAWEKRPTAGPSSTRHILTLAKHLWNWAIAEDYIEHTPFRSAQGTSRIHIAGSAHRTRRLETGEDKQILAVASPYIADLFTALVQTAARPGELRRLQWRSVHDKHIVVEADKAKTRRSREIPITPTLEKILARRRKDPAGKPFGEDDYVFGNEFGQEVHRRKLCAMWIDTCTLAKVRGLHLHDLRAEAGSQLLEAGVPVHVVRDALGHTSVAMTNTYLRGRSDALQDAYKQRHAQQARKAMQLAHVGQGSKKRKLV